MRRLHRPPLVDVLDEHCQEIGFLRVTRRAVLFASDARLRHVGTIESRIAANKDALRVAGPSCLARAERQAERASLRTLDPFQLAAALEVLVERSPGPPLSVWGRLVTAPAWSLPAWAEGLRRAAPAATARALAAAGPFADHERVIAVAADARALGEADPEPARPAGWELAPVRWAHARGLARCQANASDVLGQLDALLDDDDPAVRRAALWSLALSSPERARAVARERIAEPFAVWTLGLLGEADDVETVARALAPEATRTAAVSALGSAGSARAASLLLAIAREPGHLGELAADALERLVGRSEPEGACRADRVRSAEARAASLDVSVRWLRGQPADAVGAHSAMEALWLAAVRSPRGSSPLFDRLRREVPTGFFDCEERSDVEAGDGPWRS